MAEPAGADSTATPRGPRASAPVRWWLALVALLIVGIILIGGATRLTDSGLSITEWRPITGVLPPLNEDAWFEEFIRYQGIPEYQIVNQGMTIDEFKRIYWWEWGHRNYGRLIGLVFAVPFAFFLVRGAVRGGLALRLTGILALGGLQGFVGWYMVQSGLAEGVDVSPYRLAIHLGLPFLILAALVWTMMGLAPARADSTPLGARARIGAGVLAVLVFIQVLAGALVAGLRAGHAYNTWPLMDGALVPDGLMVMSPWYLNPFENVVMVQFDHRMLAYALLALAAWHALRLSARHPRSPAVASATLVALLVAIQALIGISTLVLAVPIWLGLVHQAGAVLVFMAAVRHLHHAMAAPVFTAQDNPIVEGEA